MTPDPKPAKRERRPIRIVDRDVTVTKLLSDPTCRSCGRQASEGHHIVRRGSPHFGDDVYDNIMPSCYVCHRDYHDGRNVVFEFTDSEVEYVLDKLGPEPGRLYLRLRYGKDI